jgi:hypothetical protein
MRYQRYIPMKHQFWSMKDQFNGNTERRHPPPHLTSHEIYEMVNNVHFVLGKQKRTGKKTKKDDLWKKQSIFWELPYWKGLDIHHSIDVMHVEKNVCESLLRTFLNTDEKSRDHGHARSDLKKKAITSNPQLFRYVHFHVLQQISIMSEYLAEHKEVLLRDNSGRNKLWLANEHMRKFIGWLQDQISQSSETKISEYLKKLACDPIFTVVTYQGYAINGYTFYTEQQDKKNTYQNSGVCVDAYDVMGQDKNMYYGQIQEM